MHTFTHFEFKTRYAMLARVYAYAFFGKNA